MADERDAPDGHKACILCEARPLSDNVGLSEMGGWRVGEGVRVSSAILEPGSRNDFLLGIEPSLIGNPIMA